MVSSAFDPLRVPDEFWTRDDVRPALERRDFAELFRLLSKRLGASQTRIGTATGLAQGTVCVIMKGTRQVMALDVLERIADGLAMPDPARMRLGLAPRGTPPAVPGTSDTAGTSGDADPPGGGELITPHDAPAAATLTGLPLPDHAAVALLKPLEFLTSSLVTPHERDRAYHQLEQVLRRWAHTMDRRDALRLLGWAAAAATLDGDEYERVVSVLSGQGRIDTATIEHLETVLWSCDRQDHALGPHAVLDTVLAQRQLAGSLLADCPAELRPGLLSVLSEASRLAGWLSFDLNQFDHAGYYYEDARARAHEAHNPERGALVLCEMSYLATWRGMARTGIDHAVAAGQWANHTGDQRLRALTFDVAAQAYAADEQRDACLTALDAAHTALPVTGDRPAVSVVAFLDEATHTSICGACHLTLHDSQHAIDYAQRSLATLDPSAVRNVAFTKLELGMAYVQSKEIDEAARLLGDAGEIAAANSSARLTERLHQARAQLRPWQDTHAVRELDDRFTTYGLA